MSISVGIIDDDLAFGRELVRFLKDNGCEARAFSEPGPLLAAVARSEFDILVIDQRLPDDSGIEIMKRIRASRDIPCMILTGAADEIDRIVSLEIGADDYVDKASKPREILARLRAILRRAGTQAGQAPRPASRAATEAAPLLGNGHWSLDLNRRELRHAAAGIQPLTSAEFEVLALLVAQQGATVSRSQLCQTAFRRPFRPGDRAVDTIVAKLRRKFEIDPDNPRVIRSVRPIGYVFTGFPEGGEQPGRGSVDQEA